jgi:hypothetical protein
MGVRFFTTAAALLVALAAQLHAEEAAAPEGAPQLPDGRMVEATMEAYAGDELIASSCILSGPGGLAAAVNESADGTIVSYLGFHFDGEPFMLEEDAELYAQLKQAGQHFILNGVDIAVYAPGADRVEASLRELQMTELMEYKDVLSLNPDMESEIMEKLLRPAGKLVLPLKQPQVAVSGL